MIAAVFPGQGSQKPGMGKELYDAFVEARAVFEEVSTATGLSATQICFELPEETLRQTQNAQLALYTCGLAACRVLVSHGVRPTAFAGHSVGEYAALAAAGVVTVESGARLVQRRGDLMARSGNLRLGGMAAILGLDRDALEDVCVKASSGGEVAVVANDNCPGQLVISGDKAAVDRAGALASEAGAKRVLPLNVSGAFHSPLMEEAAQAMGEALRNVTFGEATGAVYANVTASSVSNSASWAELLEAQLKNPVRWTESVQSMVAAGYTTFVECGAGEVLSGLIRRIDRDVRTSSVQDVATLQRTIEELAHPAN